MTNTNINVDEYKITTNKVSQVHMITTFPNNYSGVLHWCVVNGVCIVGVDNWGRASGDGRIIGCTGLPPAKYYYYTQVGDYLGNIGIDPSGNLSLHQSSGNLVHLWHSFVYPVADDWVES